MAAKVKLIKGAWWVVTHHDGKRKKRRVGAGKDHKRQAEAIAQKVNAAIALGSFHQPKAEEPLRRDEELSRWHQAYAPTLKRSSQALCRGLIHNHLAPHFGGSDLRKIRETDLLGFIDQKLREGLHPKTIHNALSVLRRVYNVALSEGRLDRNPASKIGDLMQRVARSSATEVRTVDSWTREEAATLLTVSEQIAPTFAPALHFLFYTGIRRGELLGLKWIDVDFDRYRIHIRRALVKREITTPKSGRGRYVSMAAPLAELLLDLLAQRRRECLERGWPETPEWVFPSETGGPIDQDNFERTWRRVRRTAQKVGVRPMRLHCTRHTWASLALASGKSVRWVAEQLGHADPAMTLRVYAHVIPDAETDLSFLNFGGPRRPQTAPRLSPVPTNESAPVGSDRGDSGIWRAQHDSNMRPSGPQPDALSN